MAAELSLAVASVNGTEASFNGAPLQPGTHLRWSFSRYLSYPRRGFRIERRLPWLDEFGVGSWEHIATVKLPTADLPYPDRRARAAGEALERIQRQLVGSFDKRHETLDTGHLIDLIHPSWPQSTALLDLASGGRGPNLRTHKIELLELAALEPRTALALGLYYVDPLVSGVRADYRVTGLWGSEHWPWQTALASYARERRRGQLDLAGIKLETDRRITPAAGSALSLEGSLLLPLVIELPAPVERLWLRLSSSATGGWFARCYDELERVVIGVDVHHNGSTLRLDGAGTRFQTVEVGQSGTDEVAWTLRSVSFQLENRAIGDRAVEYSLGRKTGPPTRLHIAARMSEDLEPSGQVGPSPRAGTTAVELRITTSGPRPTGIHAVRERVDSIVPQQDPLTHCAVAPGPQPELLSHAALDGTDRGVTLDGAAFRVGLAGDRTVLDLARGTAVLRNARLNRIGDVFLIDLWVHPWSMTGTIVAHAGRRRFSLALSRGTGRVALEVDGGRLESRSSLVPRRWTHIAILVRGETAHIYLDGRLDATGNVRAASGVPRDRMVLGAGMAEADRFTGALADLRVVGSALAPLHAAPADLAAAWSLNGNLAGARAASDLVAHGSVSFGTGHPELATRRVLELRGDGWLIAPSLDGLSGWDTELTLEAWVRPEPGQIWPTIFGNDWPRSVWLGLTPGDYRLRFRINGEIYESRTGLRARDWSHVAVSSDGRTVRLWIDGRLDAAHDAPVGPVSGNELSAFTIGSDNGAYPYHGRIADVRVWRRAPAPPKRALLPHHPLLTEYPLAGNVRETARGLETVVVGTAEFAAGHPTDPERETLTLDGSSFLETAYPSVFEELHTALTLDAWVRYEGPSGFPTIVGYDWSRGFWLGLTPEGHAKLWINGRSFVSRGRVSAGAWTRVTASYDGSDVRFYLQGPEPDSTFTARRGAVARHTGPLRIGADRGSSPGRPEYPFRGLLADVRIFSAALDPAGCDRAAVTPTSPVALLDRNVPSGRYRYAIAPVDAFGRLGPQAWSPAVSVEDRLRPPPPAAVRARFRPLAGSIASVAAPPELAPNVTLVTDIVLPGDAALRDYVLDGLVQYDATIAGTIAGRERKELLLIRGARAAADSRLVIDVQPPPLARLLPAAGQAVQIEYDSRLEVRWAWTGLQRIRAPDVQTFRIYDRRGTADTLEAELLEVTPTSGDPELFAVAAECTAAPRRVEPSEWIGRSCLVNSHRYHIENASARGTRLELGLRYLARPVIPPAPGARLAFAIAIDPADRDDPTLWEGRRTLVTAGDRLPPPEHFPELPLAVLPDAAYTEVRAEIGEGTPARERLLMVELPAGSAVPPSDEPDGALIGFNMNPADWGWQALRVIGARTRDGRATLYVLRPANASPAVEVVLRRVQHLRGAWFTETLDIPPAVPPDRGTQPYEVAVSAADSAPVPDPRGGPELHGNESALSRVARAMAVDRKRPARPPAPRVRFDAADFFGNSRAHLDFSHVPLAPGTRFEVHRATDSAVFTRDLEQRRRRQGAYSARFIPDPATLFDDDADFEGWLQARFPAWYARPRADLFVSEPGRGEDRGAWDAASEVWQRWAERYYPALSDAAVQALAELPGNEAAFVCVTPAPVDDSRHVDIVRGLADNRFLYRLRARSTSFAGSEGLGPASTPTRTPSVRPPRPPVITLVEGGDRRITVDWALSHAPRLAAVRIYRAESAAGLEDLRWFGSGPDPRLIATVEDPLLRVRAGEIAIPAGADVAAILAVIRFDEFDAARAPDEQTAFDYFTATSTFGGGRIAGLRPIADGIPVAAMARAADGSMHALTRKFAQPPYEDTDVVGVRDYFYRLQAVDTAGNTSEGSKIAVARAADLSPARTPVWIGASWLTPSGDAPFVHLEWTVASHGTRCIVQRRSERESTWRAVGDWIDVPDVTVPEIRFSADDRTAQPQQAYDYRIRVINAAGNPNTEYETVRVPRLEA